ncbi:MAG: hypothetical protein JWP89_4349, partial [Schlesneria sp.]|nr:hypothetical protein [Schlesneria sp.]
MPDSLDIENRVPPHKLYGCSTLPLASYLKAIGVLRIVAKQADPTAQGWWSGDVFCLHTRLDEVGLCRFFLADYRPTPIVVPWSGSDFFAANRHPEVLTISRTVQLLKLEQPERIFGCLRELRKSCRSQLGGVSPL